MLARVYSCAVVGLDGVVVEVEVDTGQGLPGMTIVGLPDAAVQESRKRVQAAVKNAGIPYPRKRIVVNLAPSSIPRQAAAPPMRPRFTSLRRGPRPPVRAALPAPTPAHRPAEQQG